MIALTDTHCHFDDDRFDHDRKSVYQRAVSAGVSSLIIPAVAKSRWEKVCGLAKEYKNVFATAGLHPVFIDQHKDCDLPALDALLAKGNCVAVGECGLDKFAKHLDFDRQRYFFEQQLSLAYQHKLPLIVHARDATEDVILTIKKFHTPTTGVIHSYNGSLEQAKQLIDMGYLLSFGGAITYDRATRLRKLVTQLPLESIMVETDAPDQPDSTHNGQRNEPGYLPEVVTTIAKLKETEPDIIANASNTNACHLFNLPQNS